MSLGLMMAAPAELYALSFGKLQVDSRLGERFEARLPLTLRPDEIVQGVQIQLGMPADYSSLELERSLAVSALNVEMVGNDIERVIKIISLEPFQEPFFNLLLKSSVGRGSYYRNFPVFLDISRENEQTVATAVTYEVAKEASTPVVHEAEATIPPLPETVSAAVENVAQTYGPVKGDDTLSSIARSIRKLDERWSVAQIAVALWKKNRESFSNDNMSGLRLGSMLTIPDGDEVGAISVQEASQEFENQWLRWREIVGEFEEEAAQTLNIEELYPTPEAMPKKIGEVTEIAPFPDDSLPEPGVVMNLTLAPGGVTPLDEEEAAADGVILATEQKLSSVQEEAVVPAEAEVHSVSAEPAEAKVAKAVVVAMQGQVEQLNGQVTSLNGQVADLNGQVTALTGDVTNLKARLQESEQSKTRLQERLAQLEAMLGKVRSDKRRIAAEDEILGGNLLNVAAAALAALLGGLLYFIRRRKDDQPQAAETSTIAETMTETAAVAALQDYATSANKEVAAESAPAVEPAAEELEPTEPEESAAVERKEQEEENSNAVVAAGLPEESVAGEVDDECEISIIRAEEKAGMTDVMPEDAVELDAGDEAELNEFLPQPDGGESELALVAASTARANFSEDGGGSAIANIGNDDEAHGVGQSGSSLEFTPIEPEPDLEKSVSDAADSEMETVDFVPVTPAELPQPAPAAPAEPMETLEFTLADVPVAESGAGESEEVADDLVLELGGSNDGGADLKQSHFGGELNEESELVLEIGYDLEDPEKPGDEK